MSRRSHVFRAGLTPIGRRHLLAWSGLVVLALIGASAVHAEEEQVVQLPPAGGGSWKMIRLPGVSRATAFEMLEIDGRRAVRASSECSASALVLRLEDVDLQKTPRLRWRWRIDDAVSPDEPRTKQGDDFAARVYVMFPFDLERASLWTRMRRRVLQTLYGDEAVPGHALSYVWANRVPEGTHWPNPYTSRSKMISLNAGPLQRWLLEEANVASDYVSLFGRAPPRPTGLGIMTDSDNSCGSATAWFAGFEFRGP